MLNRSVWFILIEDERYGSSIYGLYETKSSCRKAFETLIMSEWENSPDNDRSFQDCVDHFDYFTNDKHISADTTLLYR